ncbi:hypothetical protein [Gimesia sp.]|uniref:hypothetical protein n=1 Tax=Gimesia sp. TaxID=2024833 RepID=UPI003A92BB3E
MMNYDTSKNVVVLGIAEVFTHVSATDSTNACQYPNVIIHDGLTGSVVGIASQVKKIMGHVNPVFFTGDDAAGALVSHLAKANFKGKESCLRNLTATVRSTIQANSKVISGTALKDDTLPEESMLLIKNASGTIVGPLPAGLYELVVRVLDAASSSYLMLSQEQLQDPGLCLDLGKRATLVVCTEQQLAQLTGCTEVIKGVQWVREREVKNILVLSSTEAIGFIDGHWVHVPGYVHLEDTKIPTADLFDCFVGTLAAVHIEDRPVTDAIGLALAAVAIKSDGTPLTADLKQLQQESRKRKPMPLQLPQRPRKMTLALQSASLASSLLIGVTLGSLLG